MSKTEASAEALVTGMIKRGAKMLNDRLLPLDQEFRQAGRPWDFIAALRKILCMQYARRAPVKRIAHPGRRYCGG